MHHRWSAVVASADADRAVVFRQQVARWVAVENWRVAPSSSSGVTTQEEEEGWTPLHLSARSRQRTRMQHVESGWALVNRLPGGWQNDSIQRVGGHSCAKGVEPSLYVIPSL